MSCGTKFSKFRLKQERERKIQLIQSMKKRHVELQGLRDTLRETLGSVSDGMRSSFAMETKAAEQWLQSTGIPEITSLGTASDVSRINNVVSQLDLACAKARQLQEQCVLAYTQKANTVGQKLGQNLTETKQAFLQYRQALQLWCDEKALNEWLKHLKTIESLIKTEHYTNVETQLNTLKQEIIKKGKEVEAQEEKQQKRLYLLKALRQMCTDMGFKETKAPIYEDSNKRDSRITFNVDTLDRGKITFSLALDGIICDSEIDHTRYDLIEEFSALTEYLENKFGIITNFRLADGSPLPKLKQKGEKDLPTGHAREASA